MKHVLNQMISGKRALVVALVSVMLVQPFLPVVARADGTTTLPAINQAPSAPTISGDQSGAPGVSYTFSATASDVDGDQIIYGFDWNNDGVVDEYVGPVASGMAGQVSHSWPADGTYAFSVVAKDAFNNFSSPTQASIAISTPSTSTPSAPAASTPSAPAAPSPAVAVINTAPGAPRVDVSGTNAGTPTAFTATASDPQNDQVAYGFDWNNDGIVDQYTGYVTSGTPATLSHTWATAGTYTIQVTAKDSFNNYSAPTPVTVTIGPAAAPSLVNTAPDKPTVSGPATGTVGSDAVFTVESSDPQNDQVAYGFDWNNDGIVDQWTTYGPSGVATSTAHQWAAPGTYTFQVSAKDVFNNVSSPASASITISQGSTNGGGGNGGGGNNGGSSGGNGGNGGGAGNGGGSGTQTGGFTVSATSGMTSKSGVAMSFTVVLTSAPSANVVIAVSSSNSGEGTVSPASLMFSPANWNIPQTVTVMGQNDGSTKTDTPYTVSVGPTQSTDPNFNNLPAKTISLVNSKVTSSGTQGGSSGGNGGNTGNGGGSSGSSGGGYTGPCIGNCPVTTSGQSSGVSQGGGSVPGTVWISLAGLGNQPQSTGPNAPELVCPSVNFITTFLRTGVDNDPNEVRKLQYFLNTYESAGLSVNGTFDAPTEAAVKAFQLKYANDVLAPWGTTTPTGIVYITTSREINRIFCANNPGYAGNQDLKDIVNPNVPNPTPNGSQFQGVVGYTATSTVVSNIAGVLGAFNQRLLDALRTIPIYQLLVALLLLLGVGFTLQGTFIKDIQSTRAYRALMRGVALLAVGSVLNVLNTLSFMLAPGWLLDKTGLTLSWVLGLDMANAVAVIAVCLSVLVALYGRLAKLK